MLRIISGHLYIDIFIILYKIDNKIQKSGMYKEQIKK